MKTYQPDEALRLDFRKLRTHRRLVDVSQRALAARVGVHANAVSNWERGYRVPSVLNLVHTARTLGVRFEDLFDVIDAAGEAVKLRRIKSGFTATE